MGAPGPAVNSQTLRIAVHSVGSVDSPIPGALVTLRLTRGASRERRLANDRGVATFRLAPGLYSARIDAIGHRGTVLAVAMSDTGLQILEVGLVPEPFALPSVDIRGTLPVQCKASQSEAEMTSRLWDAARKTLQTVELSRRHGLRE